eukprot:scaffold1618_cov196-Alexandrium_tamarense.AAC.34
MDTARAAVTTSASRRVLGELLDGSWSGGATAAEKSHSGTSRNYLVTVHIVNAVSAVGAATHCVLTRTYRAPACSSSRQQSTQRGGEWTHEYHCRRI